MVKWEKFPLSMRWDQEKYASLITDSHTHISLIEERELDMVQTKDLPVPLALKTVGKEGYVNRETGKILEGRRYCIDRTRAISLRQESRELDRRHKGSFLLWLGRSAVSFIPVSPLIALPWKPLFRGIVAAPFPAKVSRRHFLLD